MGVILNNLIPIIGSSIAMSIPLVLASVGGAFSVRSGIMALGLESMMMMGAFFGVLGSYFTGSVLFGFLLGMVGTVLACLLTGVTASTYCLSLSLLLAFAMLYPEVQLLLFFVIPIRVKYFGFFAAALWVFSFLSAPLAGKLSYLLSMLNVWAFFGPMAYRSVRAWIRREQWKRKNRR